MKNNTDPNSADRFLIVYPDADIRQRIASAIARTAGHDAAIYEADFPTAAAGACRQFHPKAVFMELGESENLSLDVVETLRNQGIHVVGIYNPTALSDTESNFLRAATRAGARDFITIPPSEHDVRLALESIEASSKAASTGTPSGQIVCFLSHKGGAGTSTLALNTAATLASQDNAEVALFDADLQFGDVAELAGLNGQSQMLDLLDQLKSGTPVEPYLQREPETGLYVLGSPDSIVEAEKIGPAELSRLLLSLSRRFDRVIVDLPRVIDLNTLAVLDLADSIFVVTEPVPTAIDRSRQLVDLLMAQGYSTERIQVILNQSVSSSGYISQDEYEGAFGFEIHSLIVHDSKNLEAVSRDRTLPLFRGKSSIRRGVIEMAETILAR